MVKKSIPGALVIIALAITPANAEFIGSLQGAAAFPGYNDVRLPGNTGTRLSLTDDLKTDPVFSPRIEAGYEFGGTHFVGLMASWLRLDSTGTLPRDTSFGDKQFAAGTPVTAHYRFDSYRATYRYLLVNSGGLKFGAGASGKIRDASISLEGGGQKGQLDNTGFVPLINYYLEWVISPSWSLLTYGDMLASPYGRAEDVFAGLVYRFNKNMAIMAGYRILEGGADNDTVYTFALFHYAVIGIEARW